MSKTKAKSSPFEQTTYQRAELAALRRMLTLSEGTFSLSVAVCNSPALRDHIITHIKTEFPSAEVVALNQDTVDVLDLVRRHARQRSPQAIFIVDIEKALASDARDRVLQALNVSREPWRSLCQCPVVFWVPAYVVELLSTRARDLWSWVSHTFEFVSEQGTARAGLEDKDVGDLASASNLDIHEKQFRIAELEQRIADVGERPEGQLRKHALVWLNELAHLYRFIGNIDKAERALRRLLRWAEPDNQEMLAIAYGNLGHVYRIRGDYDLSLQSYEKSQEISEKMGDRAGVATSLDSIGAIHDARGDYEQALRFYEECRRIKEQLGDRAAVGTSLHNIGTIHHARGDYDQALRFYEQSRRIDEELGNRAGVSKSLHQIGMIHQDRGDYDQALRFYEQSRKIFEELGDRAGIATSLHQAAMIHQLRGDYDQALRFYEQSRKIKEELGDRAAVSKSLHQIGMIHQNRGDCEQALRFYEQSREILEELGDRAGLAKSHAQTGLLLIRTENYPEAFEHSFRALVIQAKVGIQNLSTAPQNLKMLREQWGAEEFDKAWRDKTRQEVPEWLKKESKNPGEEHGQAGG